MSPNATKSLIELYNISSVNKHKYILDTYNISKSEMHSLLINAFHIPMELTVNGALKQYFTRKWINKDGVLYINEGTIKRENTTYLVVYHNCTPYQLKRCTSYMCSFREADDVFNLPAYVLVKILED